MTSNAGRSAPPPTANLFAGLPATPQADEVVDILAQAPQARIERIVSTGQASRPGFWYDQPWDEWVVLLAGAQRVLQNALTDLRFNWFPREAGGAIALVAIDAPSLDAVGVWPWPRQHHAKLIDRLTEAGASDIVFDVDFSAASAPDGDRGFAEALQRAGGSVVLPAFKQWADVCS